MHYEPNFQTLLYYFVLIFFNVMSYSEGVSIRPRFSTIYFDGIHSKTLEGVEEEKRECQEEVYKIRERLAMLIAGNPKDLMNKEDWDEYTEPTSWITFQLNEVEEQLQEALQKYGELNVYERLLEQWNEGKWSAEASWEDVYDDIKHTADSKTIFPEEEDADHDFKYDILLGKKKLEDKSIEEAFNRGLENVKLDKDEQQALYRKVYATIDDDIFVTYKGQWLFRSPEEAINAINHRINIPVFEYFKNDFVNNHHEFFDSLCEWLYIDKDIDKLKSLVNDFDNIKLMSSDYKKMYELVTEAIGNYMESRVKIHYVYDELIYDKMSKKEAPKNA